MKLIKGSLLTIIFGMALCITGSAAPNELEYADDFEAYADETPLIDGIGGWYASDPECIVQTIIRSPWDPPGNSTKAASIPIDVTLSNRFQNTETVTSLWLRVDVRPVHYDGEENPAVDTNATIMFYINTNGFYVTHDKDSWVTNTISPVSGGLVASNSPEEFIRIHLYKNYETKTWDLFSNYQLITNDISFISNNLSLSGFAIYNGGGATTFLDNVYAITNLPGDLGADGGDWLPDMAVSTNFLTRTIFEGQTAAAQSYEVWKTNGYFPLAYTNTLISGDFLTIAPATAGGTSTNQRKTVDVNYNTAALNTEDSPHLGLIWVNGQDARYGFPCSNDLEIVAVTMNVQSMVLDPGSLEQSVMKGLNATAQAFDITSSGSGSYDYTVTTNDAAAWLISGSGDGTMTDADTNTINVSYSTAGLASGAHASGFKVVSTTGSGITQTVDVVMNVMELAVNPVNLERTVEYGSDAVAQSFEVWNAGAGNMAYTITTNSGDWLIVSPGTGSSSGAADTIGVTYETAALPAGVYTGVFSVAANAGGDPETVTVVMTVEKKELAIDGTFTVENKVYDGTTAATIENNNLTLPGVVGGDDVTLDPVLEFADAAVGAGKQVTLAAATEISGADAGNYTLTLAGAPVSTADITAAQLTIGGTFTVEDKVYDGTTAAVIKDNNLTLAGIVGGESVTLEPVAAFADPDVGSDKEVKLTEATKISGADAGNYALTLAGAPTATANITSSGEYLLAVEPDSLAAAAAEGSDARSQTFEVWNASASGDAMDFNVSADVGWISLDPQSGSSSGARKAITVNYSTADFAAGEYSATITVTAGEQVKTIPVQLRVVAYGPEDALNVSIDRLSVQTRRHIDPQPRTFEVWNAGTNALGYTVTKDVEWMTVTPADGVSSGERNTLEVSFDTTGMIRGRYNGKITITSANDETKEIEVFLGIGAAPYDFDGDSKSDPWYYHAPTGMWYYRLSSTRKLHRLQFGFPGTVPVPGDYDGDGQTDHAVYYAPEGLWYILTSQGDFSVVEFGFPGTIPVPGDYDGDGITDLALYYPPEGMWYVLTSGGDYWALQFGFPGAVPVQADYSGDLKTDIAVYYQPAGMWYIWTWTGDYWEIQFGWHETEPAPGDYDGSGKADIAVYHPPSGMWYTLTWDGVFSAEQFGFEAALPKQADYDGDGITDKGVFHKHLYDATWYLLRSSQGFESVSARDSRPE